MGRHTARTEDMIN